MEEEMQPDNQPKSMITLPPVVIVAEPSPGTCRLAILSLLISITPLLLAIIDQLFPSYSPFEQFESYNASLIMLVVFTVSGLVTGIISLVQINRQRLHGLWMSITSIVLSSFGALYICLILLIMLMFRGYGPD